MTTRYEDLQDLRAAGRGPVRQRLEVLINCGRLTLTQAQAVWTDAFGHGTQLIAVSARTREEVTHDTH